MIIEVEKQPKMNQYYWFTAKKTQLVTDVTVTSKDIQLHGFKQTPDYKFIEYNDLRFITHCSLDELIEQFG